MSYIFTPNYTPTAGDLVHVKDCGDLVGVVISFDNPNSRVAVHWCNPVTREVTGGGSYPGPQDVSPAIEAQATALVIEAINSYPEVRTECEHAAIDHDGNPAAFENWIYDLVIDLAANEWDGDQQVQTAIAECNRAALASYFYNRNWR